MRDHDRTGGHDPAGGEIADRVVHSGESHAGGLAARLNWLREGVLGANDGIVSVAGLVVGVAGATTERGPIFTAGIAGLAAGAVPMALGEYVSVSSQRDAELDQVAQERRELQQNPEQELTELAALYEARGLSPSTARTVAEELTARDPLAAHLDAELRLDADELTSPLQAAGASALAFVAGAVLPLLAILLPPAAWRVPVTVLVVLGALGAAGWVGARIGGGHAGRAVLRVVIGGGLGLAHHLRDRLRVRRRRRLIRGGSGLHEVPGTYTPGGMLAWVEVATWR
ncbi:VIT1/CCC1 transporter family protein [Pseudonocardia hydrocarbonoxydans]|uniref:Membrane protein n=1 Tax=Pseudonocardia hydrocarbonoxydans TaxID=76726 RepID=A0A4Y3WIQ2_9PSEU|nr:VIT family protein [Pseudonocardia hydrocarbonoxydans]GEC18625.1 membrane protein [Pseudonocardia hydrocarbonoxydans]